MEQGHNIQVCTIPEKKLYPRIISMSEIVFISPAHKLWKIHTEKQVIGDLFVLKSSAVGAAINYIKSRPEGQIIQIKVQQSTGQFQIYWDLQRDAYPPCKKPHWRTSPKSSLNKD